MGAEALASAEAHARAAYDDATGQVTQADLMKLRYGALEIERLTRVAEDGAALALAALNHTMGRPADAPLILALPKGRILEETAAVFGRAGYDLSPALSELVIMLTGRHWQAQFEFWAHARLARQAGVSARLAAVQYWTFSVWRSSMKALLVLSSVPALRQRSR